MLYSKLSTMGPRRSTNNFATIKYQHGEEMEFFQNNRKAISLTLLGLGFLVGNILLLVYASSAAEFCKNLALNFSTELIGAIIVFFLLERYINRLIKEKRIEKLTPEFLKNQFENVINQIDVDQDSIAHANEILQCYSWYKWMHKGNNTGYQELQSHAEDPDRGLSNRVMNAILWELERIRKEAYETGTLLSSNDSNLESQLMDLLEIDKNRKGK